MDVRFGDRSYASSTIVNTDANYVYTAIYVNGTLVARDEDRSTSGYVWASAW